MQLLPTIPSLPEADVCRLMPQLQTGDLLLFAGCGWTSDLVRLFTRSPWSHVAMVVRLPEHGQPLVLETTAVNESADLHQAEPKAGVVLVPLARKLAGYPGAVALRRRLGAPLDERQQRLLARLIERLRYRPYRNYVRAHLYGFLRGAARPCYSGLFCSELVAELYRRLGWLPRELVSRNLVPGHFASPRLPLADHTHLAEPCWLKPPLTRPSSLPGAVQTLALTTAGQVSD